jgi:hypothetical protein
MTRNPFRSVEPRRHENGYCAEGPGFYVWDEDRREVTRIARDLARGVRAPAAGEPPAQDGPTRET